MRLDRRRMMRRMGACRSLNRDSPRARMYVLLHDGIGDPRTPLRESMMWHLVTFLL